MYYRGTFNIFAEDDLSSFLDKKLEKMKAQIVGESDNYILNVNEIEFVKHLFDKFFVDNPQLDFDNVSVSTYEKKILGEHFPSGGFLFNVQSGKRYDKDVIRYHISFAGNETILRCMPSSRIIWSTEVSIQDSCVCFEIVNFFDNADKIKQQAEGAINRISKQLDNVRREVSTYNANLENEIRNTFQARKQHLLKKNDLIASLGVAIKKRDNLPQTFAVPTPKTRKKIQISKPKVTERGFKSEPTLEESIYFGILQILHDWGKQFERMPSTYKGKGEEDLRDLFLAFVEPYFEGSATGETFNKSGKTDILLRSDGSNVFIAECKFWRGKKGYFATLSQLLSYLTWRDSKAAAVIFVRNQNFSSVLKSVEESTSKHQNYLGFVNKKDDSWFNYRFHINGDQNREVKMAVLLFHVP